MTERLDSSGQEPATGWRDEHIAGLVDRGYTIEDVIPVPAAGYPEILYRTDPLEGGGHGDYDSELRFVRSDNEQRIADAYDVRMAGLVALHGEDNVKIAYPTAGMIEEHPEFGHVPYHILMVPVKP